MKSLNITVLQFFAALSLSLGLVFAVSAQANANPYEYQYRDAVRALIPAIENWNDEAGEIAAATLAKPELVDSAEMAELILRGHGIADDLNGTFAPEGLAADHHRVSASVRLISQQLSMLVDSPAESAEAIELNSTILLEALDSLDEYVQAGPAVE